MVGDENLHVLGNNRQQSAHLEQKKLIALNQRLVALDPRIAIVFLQPYRSRWLVCMLSTRPQNDLPVHKLFQIRNLKHLVFGSVPKEETATAVETVEDTG